VLERLSALIREALQGSSASVRVVKWRTEKTSPAHDSSARCAAWSLACCF
jgi:hypothetical protein